MTILVLEVYDVVSSKNDFSKKEIRKQLNQEEVQDILTTV
jgi:hypothetical protein